MKKEQSPEVPAEVTHWHALSAEETLTKLHSSARGLSSEEAALRREQYGKNVLKEKKKKSIWRMLWEQISDVMVIILLIAAVISIVFGDYAEAAVIFVIVVVNAVIGIVQEKKAADALDALSTLTAPTARVIRDGKECVLPAEELVPGDVVVLADGCVVPADLRLLEEANLAVQESALTGESVPVEKDAITVLSSDAPLGDRVNLAFSSSVCTAGTGTGVVVGTGMHTEVGSIAGMLDGEKDLETPIKRKLNHVGKALSVVGIVIALLMLGVGLLYDVHNWKTVLLTAISLAIAVIPEGLPATATVVMALGVRRMAKQQALVRSLPAVETLGSATVVCCDKTGTLTLNRMTVTRFATMRTLAGGVVPEKGEFGLNGETFPLARAAVLCNDAVLDPNDPTKCLGDPTEGALLTFAEKCGADPEAWKKESPRLFEQPFDSDRKRMSVVVREENENRVYTKGAIDGLLPNCDYCLTENGIKEMTEEEKTRVLEAAEEMSREALRVLGFATRTVDFIPKEGDDVEKGLIFLGLTCMIDPPRREVIGAVRSCHSAGVRVVMITGDHKTTAVAIAKELGIFREGDTALTGAELAALSDEELDKIVGTTSVYARVSPSDKLRIVKSLQRVGEVASMTGDGVNDSPALKAADIGVAMGAGTDVAKDASDIILLDNNFTTIESAIREGRRVYANIRKVVQFLLAGNIAEILLLFLTTLFDLPAPILAVHVLIINLVTDTFPALGLGVDPAGKDIMEHPPVRSGTLFERGLVLRVVLYGALLSAVSLGAYFVGLFGYGDETVAMTMAFLVLALSQLVHVANQRSDVESAFARGNGHNMTLVAAIGGSALIMAFVLFVPPVQAFFGLMMLSPIQYLICLPLVLAPLIAGEIGKLVIRLTSRRKTAKKEG